VNDLRNEKLSAYLRNAESWAEDRNAALNRSRTVAWWVAAGAGAIALLEALALVMLVPLKTTVPYTLLVDRQTGYVEALEPLQRRTVSPDAALTRSFLVQYVIARESFDIDSISDSYRRVALWSAGDARSRYLRSMQAGNPESPLSSLPRRAVIDVKIRSVSSLSAGTSLVRFTTIRSGSAAGEHAPRHWAAVIRYRFSGDAMSAEDRLVNPLGFQVLRYRKDAETLPEQVVQLRSAASYATTAGEQ
jgi:type IV secretion system protein VirB8